MNLLQAVILGIVQGVAEFLPISSSGHLALLQTVFGWEPSMTFDIVVHLGSLLAVIIVFREDIIGLTKNPFSKMTGLLIVGTLPAVVVGYILRDFVASAARGGLFLAAGFTLTGIVLVIADRFGKEARGKEIGDITFPDALVVGCMQAIAILPGISRSGMTITGALGRGMNRKTAARFSFLLSIIVITGAGVLEAVEVARDNVAVTSADLLPFAFGFLASAMVGYMAIRLLLELIKACKLRYFSYYVWALAAVILVDTLFLNRFFM